VMFKPIMAMPNVQRLRDSPVMVSVLRGLPRYHQPQPAGWLPAQSPDGDGYPDNEAERDRQLQVPYGAGTAAV
jgi:hypothetical protein